MSSKADYLKRYLSGDNNTDPAAGGKKKRRKKKDKTGGDEVKVKKVGAGVRIHDEDVDDWKRDKEPEVDDEAVVVDAAEIEAVEQKRRTYLGIKEDGSGWAVAEDANAKNNNDDDLSPPRAGRHDTDDKVGDLSPPRARGRDDSDDESDLSPPRQRGRHDSDDEDLSPPRAGNRHDSDDGDLSPPRAGTRHDSDDDESPPRRPADDGGTRASASPDQSPPRRARKASSSDRADVDLNDPSQKDSSGGGKMTDGTTAGLVDAFTVVEEADAKRELAKRRIANMSDDVSGRHATTQFRDKATGEMIDAEELARRKELASKKPTREKPVWASGVAQSRGELEAMQALAEESSNPFARSEIDKRTDDAMRIASRFGDPMAHLARKKQTESFDLMRSEPKSVVAGISIDALRKSGFRIPQEVPQHSWLRRGVGAPLNRFGINPGRHWDGVNRGTGFEHEMFKAKNDKRAVDQANWKYGQAQWE